MASHVRAQRIPARMRLPLPRTIGPLARVLLLPAADVLVVDMLHQIVHVAEVPVVAALPAAHGHLVVALPAVVLVLVRADQRQRGRRVGDLG